MDFFPFDFPGRVLGLSGILSIYPLVCLGRCVLAKLAMSLHGGSGKLPEAAPHP